MAKRTMTDTKATSVEERKRAGLFLKAAREAAGVTQLDISKAIGIEWPTMISQIEVGRARVPPARYADYARVLKMNPEDFCRELLKAYDPEMWRLLFGPRSRDTRGSGGRSLSSDDAPPQSAGPRWSYLFG